MFGFLLRRLFSITALFVAMFLLIGIPLLISGLTQTTSSSNGLLITGALLTTGALALGGWRGWKVWLKAYAIGYGRRAEATITSIEVDHSMKINNRHPRFLRYRFELPASGQKIDGEGAYLSVKEEALWSVGQTVKVAYHPEDPRVSVILPDQSSSV